MLVFILGPLAWRRPRAFSNENKPFAFLSKESECTENETPEDGTEDLDDEESEQQGD